MRAVAVATTDLEFGDEMLVTTGAGGVAVTLPSAVGRAGDDVRVKKVDAGVGALTVNTVLAQTIDGAASFVATAQGQTATFTSDGANWRVSDTTVVASSTLGIANVVADPGTGAAIPVTASATINITIGAGAETNTLANPTFAGQVLHLFIDTDGGGSRAITAASQINAAGNTVMTAQDVRDEILLTAVTVGGALRWQVTVNNGWTLS
jgi:hypothetical protein